MAQTNRSTPVHSLVLLEFEMALEIADLTASPAEAIHAAAQSAGGDLVFMLPASTGDGVTGVVRLFEDGRSQLVQVRTAGKGFAVSDESDSDSDLLGFARASIDVLERLKRS